MPNGVSAIGMRCTGRGAATDPTIEYGLPGLRIDQRKLQIAVEAKALSAPQFDQAGREHAFVCRDQFIACRRNVLSGRMRVDEAVKGESTKEDHAASGAVKGQGYPITLRGSVCSMKRAARAAHPTGEPDQHDERKQVDPKLPRFVPAGGHNHIQTQRE